MKNMMVQTKLSTYDFVLLSIVTCNLAVLLLPTEINALKVE